MSYERTPDCICDGHGTVLADPKNPHSLWVPCHECLVRHTRTHCIRCDKRFTESEGRCVVRAADGGDHFLCERCMALHQKATEDFRALVLRRRAATAAKKAAIEEFHRCRSSLDRAGYAASIVAMRAAEAEEKAALAAIDGVS